MSLYELLPRFQRLFSGLDSAHGTGRGQWIHRPASAIDWLRHLEGKGPGLGIAPLRPDSTVCFAAIDLDQPDFDLAREFQRWIPGTSFIERTRSGNAHVWVFFNEPVEAWVAQGILRYAVVNGGAPNTEVFPKAHDFSRVTLGSYINLPYFGSERPIITWTPAGGGGWYDYCLEDFLLTAEQFLNSPEDWRKRARWLMIEDPFLKPRSQGEFGQQNSLHMCADWVIEGALSGERPIAQGHRSVVYYNLAKQFANCSLWNRDEAFDVLLKVRDASDDALGQPRKPTSEIERYLRNAYEKQYTSTGCDDPVFAPYADPNCPIANPKR